MDPTPKRTQLYVSLAGLALVGLIALWLKCKPEPIPPPPPPPPPPIVTAAVLTLLEESSDRTEELTALLRDPLLTSFLSENKLNYREIDQNVVGPDSKTRPPELEPLFKAAEGKPLPLLILQDEKGAAVVVVSPIPTTAAELVARLKGQ